MFLVFAPKLKWVRGGRIVGLGLFCPTCSSFPLSLPQLLSLSLSPLSVSLQPPPPPSPHIILMRSGCSSLSGTPAVPHEGQGLHSEPLDEKEKKCDRDFLLTWGPPTHTHPQHGQPSSHWHKHKRRRSRDPIRIKQPPLCDDVVIVVSPLGGQ